MAAQITELIDKLDGFELVRDQIAAILALESANQVALAQSAGKDAEQWCLRVYVERFTAWQQFLGAPDEQVEDTSPIVNVWFDSETFDGKRSNTFEQQHATGVFNIDCYGYGVTQLHGNGHTSSDEAAAKAVQRAVRLVRNIIMSAQYTYLGFARGANQLVSRRWPRSVTSFQPEQDNQLVQDVQGARIALEVDFQEYAPQVAGEVMTLLSTEVQRAKDGKVLISADFEHPES